MALIGNHTVLNKTPGRLFSGATISGTRSNWGKSGARINRFYGEQPMNKWANIPPGYLPPYANGLPMVSGGLSSHNDARLAVNAVATGSLGQNIIGSADFATTASGLGGLIVAGTGSALFAVSGTASLIAILFASGAANVGFTVSSPSLSAIGHATGSTSFAINGTLVSYAIGHMTGNTASEALSVDSIAAAVWAAVTASNNTPGSMGEALGNAGGAANPWSELMEDNEIAGSFGEFLQTLLTKKGFIALK